MLVLMIINDKFRGWPPRGGPHSLKSDIFLDCVDRSRDLGIVFGTFCRPGRREKEIVRIDDLSRFGHRVWQPLST